MTRSVTLAVLPRAGANSKAHHYKQNVQEMKDLPKTWVLTGKEFQDFRRKKEQKHYSRPFKKTQWKKSGVFPKSSTRAKTIRKFDFSDRID